MMLKEIANWSIEAKDEDTERYFYYFDDVRALEDGHKNYVIGRKGTGKTAIAEFLHQRSEYNRFSRLLSFKNFPFNFLYKYNDDSFSRPNQYITVWTYVIYHYICGMMSENAAVTSKLSIDLSQHFAPDVAGALSQNIKRITHKSYSLSFLGLGGGLEQGNENLEFDIIAAVNVLRNFVLNNIDESQYYIIFDELDEDYRDVLNPDRRDGYFELLISLFKACQIVRSDLSKSGSRVRPIVFLRDDIFDLCRDVDKNKWLDRSVRLDWDTARLRSLINFRLSRAGEDQGTSDEGSPWDKAFAVRVTGYGHQQRIKADTFNFLLSRTFMRPRDLISYIRECARVSVSKDKKRIDNSDIKDAASAHSAYMRREIIDEMFPIVDDISEILDVLATIRKPVFTRKEFNDRFREFVNKRGRGRPVLGETKVLELLYHFNVIGNVTKGDRRVFAYDSDVKVLNMYENFCIHNGLIYSLKVL
jgi:hypothetical protein